MDDVLPNKENTLENVFSLNEQPEEQQKPTQHEQSQRGGKNKVTSPVHQRKPNFQTKLRKTLTPYLPPPVVRFLDQVDDHLHPYIGPEASVSVVASLFTAWLVVSLARWIFRQPTNGRRRRLFRALADENDEMDVLTKQLFGADKSLDTFAATVLLCGPIHSGKTRLFYDLCYGESNLPTLMSMTANVGISQSVRKMTDKDNNDNDGAESSNKITIAPAIRYVDWPGHACIDNDDNSVLQPIFKLAASQMLRIVLVLDATQPVSSAVDILYELLSIAHSYANNVKYKNKVISRWPIMIACHKKDIPKAKNAKRVKIQIRTELERLLQLRSKDETAQIWWPTTKPLELDDLDFAKLCFVSTTCSAKECSEVKHFCTTGEFPTE